MDDHRTIGGKPTEKHNLIDRRIVLGVLAGGGLFIAAMILLAAMSILFGWIKADETGSVDLGSWLILEVLGGTAACFLAGWVSRIVSGRFLGPAVLALFVCSVGLLEAAEILRHVNENSISASKWLVIGAPFVAALGILFRGFRRSETVPAIIAKSSTFQISVLWRYAVPTTVLLSASLLALLVLPNQGPVSQTTVFASALTLDLTLVFPGFVYLFLVRMRHIPWLALVPALAIGYGIATLSVNRPNTTFLEYVRFLVIPAEFGVVTYLFIQVRRKFTATREVSGDIVTRLRSATAEMLGNRIAAGIVTTEFAILYHAFRWTTPDFATSHSFTVHRKSGYGGVLIGMFIALFMEAIALHFLVSEWSNIFAWILTGLSVYAAIWCLGNYRAFSARPILLTSTDIHLRIGVRWEARVAIDSILEVKHHNAQTQKSSDAFSLVVFGMPNLSIKLKEPVELIGMYGMRRKASEICIQVDEAPKLTNELQARLDNVHARFAKSLPRLDPSFRCRFFASSRHCLGRTRLGSLYFF